MKSHLDGAELLVEMLHAYGIEYVFGLPGDTNTAFYAALAAKPGLTHVMTRDERGAGYMADAYARVSGRPGIVEVPSGGGPLYAIAAVAEAHFSSIPVIILTCDTPLAAEGRGFIAEFDTVRMFEPVCKASFKIKSADKIPESMRRAFRIATSGKPGAVHISVPDDIFRQDVDAGSISLHAEAQCRRYPAFPACASVEDVAALHALLAGAKRALIVAGGGAVRARAHDEIQRLAERFGIPVVTTITGQDAMPDRHPLALGNIGDNGFHPHANRAMEESDTLLYVGCRIGSTMTLGWTFPAGQERRTLAQIDIDPTVLGNNYVNALSIAGDARAILRQLNALPPPESPALDPGWVPALNQWRERFWRTTADELDELRGRESAKPVPAQLVIESVRRRLRGRFTIISDPGTPTPYLCRLLRRENRDTQLVFQRAFGALGYAIPAVVGAWYADREARPIGMFGDGSLGMSVGDLETIARLRIPAILINFNNACFGYIKALQRSQGFDNAMSVNFSQQDCAMLARSYGIHGIRVERVGELDAALDEAFAHQGPVFLDILVRSVADEIPPMFKWLERSGVDPLSVGGSSLTLDLA